MVSNVPLRPCQRPEARQYPTESAGFRSPKFTGNSRTSWWMLGAAAPAFLLCMFAMFAVLLPSEGDGLLRGVGCLLIGSVSAVFIAANIRSSVVVKDGVATARRGVFPISAVWGWTFPISTVAVVRWYQAIATHTDDEGRHHETKSWPVAVSLMNGEVITIVRSADSAEHAADIVTKLEEVLGIA